MIVEADGWPPPDYKYGRARAPAVHLFLLLSFFFFLALAPLYANGADPPVFSGREGEGPPRGSRPASAEEAAYPRLLRRGRMAGDVEALVRAAAT